MALRFFSFRFQPGWTTRPHSPDAGAVGPIVSGMLTYSTEIRVTNMQYSKEITAPAVEHSKAIQTATLRTPDSWVVPR